MRSLLPLLIALATTRAWADASVPNAVGSSRRHPVVALIETSPTWHASGWEPHNFVLYDDGLVIYGHEAPGGYFIAQLDESARRALLAELRLPELYRLNRRNDSPWGTATSWIDPENVLYVSNGSAARQISIKANLRQPISEGVRRAWAQRPDLPPVLAHALEVLSEFRAPGAQIWDSPSFDGPYTHVPLPGEGAWWPERR